MGDPRLAFILQTHAYGSRATQVYNHETLVFLTGGYSHDWISDSSQTKPRTGFSVTCSLTPSPSSEKHGCLILHL